MRIMKTELEIVFFESTIIDIDFSQWRNFLQLIIVSDWVLFNKEMIPLSNVNIIKFHGLKEFHCKSDFSASNDLSEHPGISVSNINEVNTNTEKIVIIEGSAFDLFSIKYSFYEIIPNAENTINIPKKNIEQRLFLKNHRG